MLFDFKIRYRNKSMIIFTGIVEGGGYLLLVQVRLSTLLQIRLRGVPYSLLDINNSLKNRVSNYPMRIDRVE